MKYINGSGVIHCARCHALGFGGADSRPSVDTFMAECEVCSLPFPRPKLARVYGTCEDCGRGVLIPRATFHAYVNVKHEPYMWLLCSCGTVYRRENMQNITRAAADAILDKAFPIEPHIAAVMEQHELDRTYCEQMRREAQVSVQPHEIKYARSQRNKTVYEVYQGKLFVTGFYEPARAERYADELAAFVIDDMLEPA